MQRQPAQRNLKQWNGRSRRPQEHSPCPRRDSGPGLGSGKSIAPHAYSFKITLTNAGSVPLQLRPFRCPANISLAPNFCTSPLMDTARRSRYLGQDFAFERRAALHDNCVGHCRMARAAGIPVVYFWNKTNGVALMHIERRPRTGICRSNRRKEGVTAALQLHQPVTLHLERATLV